MDSPCDSDDSEGMQELVRRGFAIRRERELDYAGDDRVQFHDIDVSHVQRPLALNLLAGVASTHGLIPAIQESVTARGRNTGTTEAGFEAVGETRSTTRGGPRRSDVRASSDEEMFIAYDELEKEMNELKNNIGRRINPNDADAMRAWRERIRSVKKTTLEDIEERASQLAEAALRIRDRTYAGARVIKIAPITEISATD